MASENPAAPKAEWIDLGLAPESPANSGNYLILDPNPPATARYYALVPR